MSWLSDLYADGRQHADARATVRSDKASRGARAGITTSTRPGIQRATSACRHYVSDIPSDTGIHQHAPNKLLDSGSPLRGVRNDSCYAVSSSTNRSSVIG